MPRSGGSQRQIHFRTQKVLFVFMSLRFLAFRFCDLAGCQCGLTSGAWNIQSFDIFLIAGSAAFTPKN